ncbi:chromosome segregation protein [Sphingomonas gilva]|uniref:Chromosome partition protein Smc n=1 Tax=Sphingomonas gilva TaxID=2305907 RepID=A0A396RV91_9SPHN|nr:AAA family ATPase [Sphingomonas gilva]RHW18383.1 chromosome segregation protein [Sphingomonas gilva]
MQIRRLRLTGFKSFVDPADLRIEHGLTGVVGPNGCGKSNLLEALRWTMGENSPKSMRGAGMEDVIFAGTATRPPRDFAEVSILAEGAGEEIEIVRRIERGAGSAYRINGRDVRAKDVALLFADAATGAHSPALVSQGRIGAVIAAKPADRRAMLEEAAGIAGLHVRRRDAEQKLRATEANLSRLDELLGDMEGRAGALKRQARQAERYRKLSDEIRVAEARMIFVRWREAAAAADAAKAEAGAAEAAVQAAAEAQRGAAAYVADAAATLATARRAAQDARDAERDAGHKLEALRIERRTVEARIGELARARDAIAADREREGALANDAAGAIDRLTAEAKQIEARLAEGEGGRPALTERVVHAERAVRDAEIELAQALAEQASEQAETRVRRAAEAAAKARLERSEAEGARLRREADGLGDAAPLEVERDALAGKARNARDEVIAAEAALSAADAARTAALAARETAQGALASARAERSALEGEAKALARGLEGAKGGRAIDAMLAEPGYERALAAALGDDIEAGLSEGPRWWAGAEGAGDPALPAGLEPLADHVRAPAALARRLAQVGVGEDAGQALAVGQRLVTREGRLRRWDGFVASGDGAAAAERLERANRLAEIERVLPAARDAEAAAAGALGDAETRLRAAGEAGEAARGARARAEAAEREALREGERVASAIERLAGRRADLDQRIARAAEDAAAAGREADATAAALADLPDPAGSAARVAALSATAEARRAEVAEARAASATLDRALAADRERLGAGAGEIKGWRARAGEAARRIADMARREAAALNESETLAGKPDALAARIAEVEDAASAARDAAAALAARESEAEAALRANEAKAAAANEALSSAREVRAGALARAENQELRRVEMGRVSGERFECPPPVLPEKLGFSSAEVRGAAEESARHERLSAERERIGPVNLVAESELAALEAEHVTLAAERDELGQAVNRLRGSIGSLNREGRQRLLAAFEAVDGHFRRLFTTLFNGGQAHLALIDSDDPLEAGLEIMAQPPGKRLQSLTLLSGGEQALTAVALIFGLFLTNPAPICVLDEVDAPLDDANIERFCDLLDRMAAETDTRYLIVTHNAVTMSRMHRLFGVTMIEKGVSRLVSVDLGGAEQLLAAE